MSHILVVANETVASDQLLDAVRGEAEAGADLVTVLAPVNPPASGYVVYVDTRRAAAGRRLDRTLSALREAGISAHGLVVDTNPVEAVRDALAQLEPRPDRIVVSTHPAQKSGWLRKHVVDKIRERAARGPASFLIISPQSDPNQCEHPEAERRLRRALTILRGEGVDIHGQVAHPDPYTAAVHAVEDERIDEIIVSTFAPEKSGWLRRDLVERLRKQTGLPVEHVMFEGEPAGVS